MANRRSRMDTDEIINHAFEDNSVLFTEKLKVSDLVLSNNRLLFVFPRFGFKLGMGDMSVKEMCQKHNVSLPLFLLICNIYTNFSFFPTIESLHSFDLSDLLGYLHNSHDDYINNRIPALKRKIMFVANSCGSKGEILKSFFEQYIKEVLKHFSYEEKKVFPYVEKLLSCGLQSDFNIAKYEKNHTDIEDKLVDLKNILIKYVAEADFELVRETLIDLYLFEDDLERHSLIENKIVVPLVSEIENSKK